MRGDDGVVAVFGRPGRGDGGSIEIISTRDLDKDSALVQGSGESVPYSIGDVDGDGFHDLGLSSRDVLTILFGGNRMVGAVAVSDLVDRGRAVHIHYPGSRAVALTGGGDFNGDGIDDLVVHSSYAIRADGYGPGKVIVVFGRRSWPSSQTLSDAPDEGLSISSTTADLQFGRSAALIGDLTGDRRAELLVGAPGVFWRDEGRGLLFPGVTKRGAVAVESFASGPGLTEFLAVKEKDSLGFDVTSLGDFNGDGVEDFALGALAGSIEFAGESYVVFGGMSTSDRVALGDLTDGGLTIRGEFAYDVAVDLAPLGDFNGDGLADLLVAGGSVTDESNPFPARAYVVLGGSGGLLDLANLGDRGLRIHTGSRAESVGGTDFNGDGFDDAVVRGSRFVSVVFGFGPGAPFVRGDSDRSGDLSLADPIRILNYLFVGTGELRCRDAGDANDSGTIDLTDAVYLLGYLFLGSEAPPPPFPDPGPDPTADELRCPN